LSVIAMFAAIMDPVRAVIKDGRGLESLEYAVFAGALLVMVAASIAGLLGNVETAYSEVGAFIAAHAAQL
jgi:Flp pilus assembly pilin Flp